MAMSFELYHETGANSGGRGTTITQVYDFPLMPLTAPTPGNTTYSYEQYVFVKLVCENTTDYGRIKGGYLLLSFSRPAAYAGNTTLRYRVTNTYTTPVNTAGAGMTAISDTYTVKVPINTHSSGPHLATAQPEHLDGSTVYSCWVVFQFSSTYDAGVTYPVTLTYSPTIMLMETLKP